MESQIPCLVIAATQSGAGKTTIVTGLLAAWRAKGVAVQSFKVGPDYIDPGYHQLASGRPGMNLDTWLTPKEKLPAAFAREMGWFIPFNTCRARMMFSRTESSAMMPSRFRSSGKYPMPCFMAS